MRRLVLCAPLVLGVVLACADTTSAFGRRGGQCVTTCWCPCPPYWPDTCCHHFAFWAWLKHGHPYPPYPYVDARKTLPIQVLLTNYECCWWHYHQSDYCFQVYDEHGHHVHNAVLLPYLVRTIWVPPCATILDEPVGIRLNMRVLHPNRRYTMCVSLCGHVICFPFIPRYYSDTKEETGTKEETTSSASPATIIVNVPADATLTIDGKPTTSTSGRRVFVTPDLAEGKEHQYTLRAEAVRDGQVRSVTRTVAVQAGQETEVSLDLPTATVVVSEE